MAIAPLSQLVADQITHAVPGIGDPAVRLSEHADLQANGLLTYARATGCNPRELATSVAAALDGDPIGKAEPAGPGFLNITLTDAALREQTRRRLADDRLGLGTPERGRTTVVDYSQPNVAKEMHVGHLRSTVIGDALVRVLEHRGGTVIRQNHLGDWGTQFGMLVQHRLENPDTSTYREAQKAFTTDPAFAERARKRVVALQSGDPRTRAVWRDLVTRSMAGFQEVYDLLDVRLTPDDAVGESAYNDALPLVADELERTGIAVHSDGALCVFDGDDVLIVRKSDGGFGYAATDLAAMKHRTERLHADRILYVIDARQALHLQLVFATARRAGWIPDGVSVEHVAFGTVLGKDGKPFKTRSGYTVRLKDLLDAAVAKAGDRAVGVGAVKYADLSTGRTRDYVYDPDRMLALTGNTSVYLQYAYARTRSVLAKAGPAATATGPRWMDGPERRLALLLDGFAQAVDDVAATYEPHRLCTYLYGLAQAFATFYERCPVLTAPDDGTRADRLDLCRLTGATLRTGLDLLGIAAPERL